MLLILCASVFLTVTVGAEELQSYKSHTTWQEAFDVPTPYCGSANTLTATQKTEFLKLHNDLRRQVAREYGVSIPDLVWDDNISKRAQQLANTCVYKHDLLTDCNGVRMGQNIGVHGGGSSIPAVDPKYMTMLWFNEKPDYNYNTNTCKTGKQCGHYTQIVWKKTTKLGCAVVGCANVKNAFKNARLYVCNYSPAGNVSGQRPF